MAVHGLAYNYLQTSTCYLDSSCVDGDEVKFHPHTELQWGPFFQHASAEGTSSENSLLQQDQFILMYT